MSISNPLKRIFLNPAPLHQTLKTKALNPALNTLRTPPDKDLLNLSINRLVSQANQPLIRFGNEDLRVAVNLIQTAKVKVFDSFLSTLEDEQLEVLFLSKVQGNYENTLLHRVILKAPPLFRYGFVKAMLLAAERVNDLKIKMLNAVEINGNSPLHSAAFKDDTQIIRLLIAHGGPTASQNRKGDTPFSSALLNDNLKAALCLFDFNDEKNIGINSYDYNSKKPLHIVLKKLLDLATDPQPQGYNTNRRTVAFSPQRIALIEGYRELVSSLSAKTSFEGPKEQTCVSALFELMKALRNCFPFEYDTVRYNFNDRWKNQVRTVNSQLQGSTPTSPVTKLSADAPTFTPQSAQRSPTFPLPEPNTPDPPSSYGQSTSPTSPQGAPILYNPKQHPTHDFYVSGWSAPGQKNIWGPE